MTESLKKIKEAREQFKSGYWGGHLNGAFESVMYYRPDGFYDKEMYEKKLIIAAALIVAELDRLSESQT